MVKSREEKSRIQKSVEGNQEKWDVRYVTWNSKEEMLDSRCWMLEKRGGLLANIPVSSD
jgi:hypothetical protein